MLKFTYKALKKGIFNRYIAICLALVVVFAAGVFANSKIFKPDLHRLYMESMAVTDQPPVIFIHGVLGSRLKDTKTKEDIWPGAISRLFSHDYSDAAYEINSNTLEPKASNSVPYDIFDGAAGQDFYGKIVHTLSDVGGYKLTQVGKKVNPKQKNYYVFLYDWRQDNVKSAGELADFIEQVRLDYNDPKLKVDIVAHSMGGLITRYYIRYGKQDVVNDNDFDKKLTMYGAERVRRRGDEPQRDLREREAGELRLRQVEAVLPGPLGSLRGRFCGGVVLVDQILAGPHVFVREHRRDGREHGVGRGQGLQPWDTTGVAVGVQQVASNLLLDESIVGRVSIEARDHVVPIAESVGIRNIFIEPIGVRKSSHV